MLHGTPGASPASARCSESGDVTRTPYSRPMLWRAALASWLMAIAGLALVFAYWDVDRIFYLGAALTILGPLVALGVVIRQRTPEAVFVFLLALVVPVFLGVLLYLVARNAN
jgi:hypothetical protein